MFTQLYQSMHTKQAQQYELFLHVSIGETKAKWSAVLQ